VRIQRFLTTFLVFYQQPDERGLTSRGSTSTQEHDMSVVHTSRLRIEKHEGPHRTAHLEGFAEPIHFGIHGGIKQFYKDKYGREITGPEYPATLDYIIAGVAG
jgi:hypothetical protein